MINLRYHIVSITAVFLALAIGVAMGTSFLGKATVEQLKSQIGRTEARINATEKANSELSGQVRRFSDRDKAMRQQGGRLFNGRLPGDPVLIIASAGVDSDSLAALQSTLEATDADFKGTLFVNTKLELQGDEPTKLSQLLKISSTRRAEVRRVLISRFSQMLEDAAKPTETGDGGTPGIGTTTTAPKRTTTTAATTAPASGSGPTTRSGATVVTHPRATTSTTTPPVERPEPRLLTDLRDGGWLSYQPPKDGSGDDPVLTTDGYRYVVVSGPDPVVPNASFLLPLLTDIADAGPAPVVVSSAAVGNDPDSTRTAAVGPVRDDSTLQKNLSTVDDLESFEGQAAVVLALEDLNEVHGHYGLGDGATSLLPPAP